MHLTQWAAFSCTHCPFQNEQSVAWLLDQLAKLSPRPNHLIMLGDLFDASAASVHPDEFSHVLEDEYLHGAEFLMRCRAAVPWRCEYWWLLGNHDDNLQRADKRRIPKELRSVVNWNKFGSEFNRWRQLPYVKAPSGVLQLGQVMFTHGFESGSNSGELEALQLSYMLGGTSHRLVVRGHTHRPEPVTQCMKNKNVPLPFWHANAGTLGPLQPSYMHRKNAFLWGPGLVVGECALGYNPLGGRQWTAELLTPKE